MEQEYQVVILDDDKDYAKTVASFIETKCKIGCLYFGASDEDISKLNLAIVENPIKIVILDQKLREDDSLKGTDLVRNLKCLNSHLQFIMLTGQAQFEDASKAHMLGYSDLIHKSESLNKMPDIIFRCLAQYASMIRSDEGAINKVLKRGIMKTWTLIDQKVINENYVDDSKWIPYNRVDRGVEMVYTEEVEVSLSNELIISCDAASDFNFNIKLKSLLDTHFSLKQTNTNQKSTKITNKKRIQTQKRMSLSPDENHEGKLIVAKEYQLNQIYKQLFCNISIKNRFSKREVIKPIQVLIPLNKMKCRQLIITEDNLRFVVDTGVLILD